MSELKISNDNLSSRFLVIRQRLSVLRTHPNKVSPWQDVAVEQSPNGQVYILGSHDGMKINATYRDWRFSTIHRNLKAMYFEIWQPTTAQRMEWELHQAYFSLYHLDRNKRKEREVLSIHCDPLEKLSATHYEYKRGPHLHVSFSPSPLPEAHFGLNQYELTEVLSNISNLDRALAQSIRMVRDQVLTLDWDIAHT
ncbi:MAG: hypothetical protein JWO30_3601 [Fibrobacteres bacterium]|nr:hypothetical protein [Fibrobacterota bacterium]